MTDAHSHILFGIDDGSSSLKESIELLKKMKDTGFNNVILTPHYIEGSVFNANNIDKMNRYEMLLEELEKQNIDINIYLGNEIFISNNILSNIKRNQIFSLNNTKYLLIELPFHNKILNLEDIIYEIKVKGYIPIIAHPERYTYFQENKELINKLREEDVLFQANYASILGYYGKSSEKLMKYMLKKGYIDYLGTDIHHLNKSYVLDNFSKIKKHIIKYTGSDYFNQIIDNCNSLIND
ncbi:MAG: capsular biosynthesis protein [Bacilli bacterium]|nr:capsular biosynthesis protein [Bacilli bacterium]